MTLVESIAQHAASFPEKIAVISGNEEISYSVLWDKIQAVAAYFLHQPDLKKGDRILLAADKNLAFVYAYFGIHLAGFIAVPIDSNIKQTRLERIISIAEPARKLDNLDFVNSLEPAIKKPTFPDENQFADILFTTGTTGLPKGVTLTHKNLFAAATNINTFIQNTQEDVELLALPISHSFGLGRLRCIMQKGSTIVLLGSFANVKKFYRLLEEKHVTGFGMVPSSWKYLSMMSGDMLQEFANQLKYIELGSAYLSKEEKEHLMHLLPHTRLMMHYGLTEASRSTFLDFKKDIQRLNSIGKPSPNVEVRIMDEAGQTLPIEMDGEICIKGQHVCTNYWGQSDAAYKKDFHGEYFRTGDWGHLDAQSYVHLQSRIKEIINIGGKKVSPYEVEEVLNTIPGIVESVCIGIPDKNNVLGEVVKAFLVVSNPALHTEEITKFLSGKLEPFKIPVEYEFIDAIPKTESGKIQRLMLK